MEIKNIKIIDILQDGRAVAKTQSKTAFIEGAIYGEVCNIKVNNEKKNFFEAEKTKTLEKSPYLRKPPCPYYYECGGCSIMDINYKSQIKLKKNLIKNALLKSVKIKIDDIEILEGKEFGYRNKIRLQINKNGKLAYNKKYSNDLVEIKDCLLAKDLIRKNLEKIEEITKDIIKKYPNSLEEITIRANEKEILLNIKIKDKEIIPYIKNQYKNSTYNINLINKKEKINISGKDYLIYNLLGKKFKISMNDFYQVNDNMTKKLYKTAKDFLGENQKVLDLFCGSATSSIAINDDHVIGIEREYVTILGIFASIVLAFVGGITFTTSVLQNIDKVSVFRLILTVDVIGAVLVNVIYLLISFILKINDKDKEGNGKCVKNANWILIGSVNNFVYQPKS